MAKFIVAHIPQPNTKLYWVEQNRFSEYITNAHQFDTRDEALDKVNEIYKETSGELDCFVEEYKETKTWGIRKSDGTIDWKKLGVALSLLVLITLFTLLLVPQLIMSKSVDLTLWIDSVKYCIEKWIPIAGIECGVIGGMGIASNLPNNNEVA